mgnify:CR=1 FL=1
MYNTKSDIAEEFICHDEILESLKFSEENKNNLELIDKIIEKGRQKKGLTHREALLLLDCTDEEKNKEIYALAEQIKKEESLLLHWSLQGKGEGYIYVRCQGKEGKAKGDNEGQGNDSEEL